MARRRTGPLAGPADAHSALESRIAVPRRCCVDALGTAALASALRGARAVPAGADPD